MTKNVEARALPNKQPAGIAKFFHEDIVCRHGTPAELNMDHGGEFEGAFLDMLEQYHIDRRLSSPYHPQTNGLVERFNQTLGRALRNMVDQHPERWDQHIATILMGYRASMQASTEYSPFFLLHGREMVLPVHNLHRLRAPEADSIDPTAETLVNNLQPLQDAWDSALVNISRKQAKMQRLYAQKQLHGQDPNAKNKAPMLEADPTTPGAAETAALPAAAAPTTVPTTPTRAPLQSIGSKRGAPDASVVQVGDFVLVKIHGRSTTDKAKGKLAAKVEGPYYLASFTDDTQAVANIEDAEGTAWKRKTSDLSKYTGNA